MIDKEFTEFCRAHYGDLVSFATWWGNNHHDAEEAVSALMEYMYGRWREIRDPKKYARRAVTRTLLKMRRDRRDDLAFPVPGDQMPDGMDRAPDFDRLEGEQWVDEQLAKLPEVQYQVLRRFLDGLSMKEIADELRKSESTIRQNFKLARDRLRPHVKEYDRRQPCPLNEHKRKEEGS
ncbi:sigma-70 family RNA polymerase sigma factor [Micromonospora peucetia]|uniref:RNA polymerase sigma factor n=1 Tax=Micromonospora peucetia TaxID=47871 RepID=UPI00331DAFBA